MFFFLAERSEAAPAAPGMRLTTAMSPEVLLTLQFVTCNIGDGKKLIKINHNVSTKLRLTSPAKCSRRTNSNFLESHRTSEPSADPLAVTPKGSHTSRHVTRSL